MDWGDSYDDIANTTIPGTTNSSGKFEQYGGIFALGPILLRNYTFSYVGVWS